MATERNVGGRELWKVLSAEVVYDYLLVLSIVAILSATRSGLENKKCFFSPLVIGMSTDPSFKS